MFSKYTIMLILSCFCGSLLLGLSRAREMTQYPVLGSDMILAVQVMEDHKDALAHWQDIGVKGSVLVNIDAHDDMRRLPVGELTTLKSQSGDLNGRQDSVGADQEKYPGVSNGNFIQSAAREGIVKKVVWVVPDTFELFSDSGQRLVALLKKYGFADSDISTFKRKNQGFAGLVDGVPLLVCDIGSLPDLKEPVLLTIDMDYFPEMIRAKRSAITAGLKNTFIALSHKKYKVRDVTIAYSINGGFLDCRYRWTGELVADILRVPGILSQKELPYRYSYLQNIDHLLLSRQYRELLQEFSLFQLKGGSDPNLFLYAATACLELGQLQKAFQYAEKACLADNGYCYGLADLGTRLLDMKNIAAAERFFLRGYELSPTMDLGQFRLGMTLKKTGNFTEALKYFKVFRENYGPFPIDFYIAETYLLKGDKLSALNYYDSGRSEIIKNPSLLDRFGDYAVIDKYAALYEQQAANSISH